MRLVYRAAIHEALSPLMIAHSCAKSRKLHPCGHDLQYKWSVKAGGVTLQLRCCMTILNEDYGQTSLTMYGLTGLRFCLALMLSVKDCPLRLQIECSVARDT
jgi:hypothetical protein